MKSNLQNINSIITIVMSLFALVALTVSAEIRAGVLYVSDLGNYPNSPSTGGVRRFDSVTGSPMAPIPFLTGFATEGVTCLLINGVRELFVADITNNVVHVYNADTGFLLRDLNPGGSPNGGISLSPDGKTLYVPVDLNHLVALNSITGAVEYSTAPTGIYLHDAFVNQQNGTVYSQEIIGGDVSIVSYSADLSSKTTFISNAEAASDGLSFPTGMAIDLSGNFWVANYLNNSVFEYDPSGTFLRKIMDGTLLSSTFDVSLGPDGNIYATSFGNDSITKIDVMGGTYALSTFVPNPDAGPRPKYLVFDSECCNVPEPSILMLLFTWVSFFGFWTQFHRRHKPGVSGQAWLRICPLIATT